jgi:hypothetical protein
MLPVLRRLLRRLWLGRLVIKAIITGLCRECAGNGMYIDCRRPGYRVDKQFRKEWGIKMIALYYTRVCYQYFAECFKYYFC